MNHSLNTPARLREQIADLVDEINTTEAQAAPNEQRISALTEIIADADKVLRGPYRFPDHKEAQAAKSAAYSQRAAIAQKVQTDRRQISELNTRLSDVRRELRRCEYEAVTPAELVKEIEKHTAAIQAVDRERAALASERETLHLRQREAKQAIAAVSIAEGELHAAQEAREEAQGAAFIAGADVDLTKHTARIAVAEKRLADATKSATAGRAALPRIAARLEAIDCAVGGLDTQRVALTGAYWRTRQRFASIDFKEAARRLIDSGNTLAALDGKTGGRLGSDLLAGLQSALRMPIEGGYTEAVRMGTPDLPGIADELEKEFAAALEAVDQEM